MWNSWLVWLVRLTEHFFNPNRTAETSRTVIRKQKTSRQDPEQATIRKITFRTAKYLTDYFQEKKPSVQKEAFFRFYLANVIMFES